ncbi:acetyltransferase [Flavobacterium pedocola]
MYLYGASGHSKVIVDIIKELKGVIEAVLDDYPKTDSIYGLPVMHPSAAGLKKNDTLIISIGDNSVRKKIAQQLEVTFTTAVHPSAIVSESASLGEGSVVMPNAVVNAFSEIGKHCIINSGAIVEHDCKLEDFVHISPNAALAGNVNVGEGSQVGIGASVIQGVTIGKWAVIGAGTVVLKDVPDYAVVVGNPGKVIKNLKP